MDKESVEWFINSGESDREVEKNITNCFVLFDGDRIIGFNIFFDDFIHVMMVDHELQLGGYGTKFLYFAEQKVSEKGFSKIRFETFDLNEQAVNFYKKNNWKLVKSEREEALNLNRVFFEKEV